MAKKVLITGASGLIGSSLTGLLLEKGYDVCWLGRRHPEHAQGVKIYLWDIEKGYVEEGALDGASVIIHLAGAGIADKRWSDERKKVILESRTHSTALLAKTIKGLSVKPEVFITASGTAYYGADTGNRHNIEESPVAGDFIGNVVKEWEKEADVIAGLGVRTVKLRTGIVLSAHGGALEKMAMPVKWGLGAPLGKGTQWLSWIHMHDLCHLYLRAMEDESFEGAYNAVAPGPVTNAQLIRQIATTLGKPAWLPAAPGFLIRLMLGEMAGLLLGSNYVVNRRVMKETDFTYRFTSIEAALADALKSD